MTKLLDGDDRGLSDDTDLLATGILNSFAILEFTFFLQQTFSPRLSLHEMKASDFRNISSIVQTVDAAIEADTLSNR